ncbi:hypothetical protein CcCBS67573_g03925 [Chytriomyces confervae]|uniref:Uncharacterized protein n=1 Tax=Chytriomyces confervae TaxID=246404 RepID=A0A507FGT0_9FUNG|nr:hypothetical protein CcCBS67573_g03925 [Chytriomyces confervae]
MFKRFFRRRASSDTTEELAASTHIHGHSSVATPSSPAAVSCSSTVTTPSSLKKRGMRVNTEITCIPNSQVVAIRDTIGAFNSMSLRHEICSPNIAESDDQLGDVLANSLTAADDSFYAHTAKLRGLCSTGLLDLPTELIIKIAHYSGFIAATRMMHSHEHLHALLNTPAAWHAYKHDAHSSSDVVESHVQICTKIHTFDHLVFGTWNNDSSEPSVYFEHFTFNEAFDFLGGVEMGVLRSGKTTSACFEHREALACYQKALVEAVRVGALPPSAPHGGPPPGAKIDHNW